MSQKKLIKVLVMIVVLSSLLLTSYSLLPTYAQEPSYDEINEVAQELNCPTCAGISLSDCRTQTCTQWKDQIGDLLAEGMTKQEVLDYFVTQYGSQVLQEPPKSGFTLGLWLIPVVAVLAGGVWLFYILRGWKKEEPVLAAAAVSTASPIPQDNTQADDYLSKVEKDLEA